MVVCRTCSCENAQAVSEANSEGMGCCLQCGQPISSQPDVDPPTSKVAGDTEETRQFDSRNEVASNEMPRWQHEFGTVFATETRISLPSAGEARNGDAESEDFDITPPATDAVTQIADPQATAENIMFLSTKTASSASKDRLRSSAGLRRSSAGSRMTEMDLKQPILVAGERSCLPAPGSHLDNGQYGAHRILRKHQEGGMGKILIAYDQFLKRDIALKELRPEFVDDRSIVQRFIGEAETTAQLEHPGIVPVHTLGLNEGDPYYTMKLIKGQTLQDAIKTYHKKPTKAELPNLVRRLANVCKTMAFAHNKGVIHRDLKPANIMLGEHGETLVMDWGLAKWFLHPEEDTASFTATALTNEARQAARPELTMVGAVVGTLAFMSPEQATPEMGTVGPLSDVFSIGAVLYYLLTGQTAFSGRSTQDILSKVRNSTPIKPSLIKPYVPSDLEAVCLKAMERNPADRYQSADEMFVDLCRWLDNEPVQARKETFFQRIWRRIKRNRQISLSIPSVLALIVLMVVAGIVVGQFTSRKALAEIEDAALNQSVDLLLQPSVDIEGTDLSFLKETKRTGKGEPSLQVIVLKKEGSTLTVMAPGQRTWDLTTRRFLSFSILERESEDSLPINNFFVRLGKGSAYFEYRPLDDWWSKRSHGSWSTFSIPLSGSVAWTKTAVNDPSMAQIRWIELHFGAEQPTILWIDNLLFSHRKNNY